MCVLFFVQYVRRKEKLKALGQVHYKKYTAMLHTVDSRFTKTKGDFFLFGTNIISRPTYGCVLTKKYIISIGLRKVIEILVTLPILQFTYLKIEKNNSLETISIIYI